MSTLSPSSKRSAPPQPCSATLQRPASPARLDPEALLIQACQKQSFQRVSDLLAAGANPNSVGSSRSGYLPLAIACRNNDLASAKLLIERGADVNAIFNGRSALHCAASLECLALLLGAGANPNLQSPIMSAPIFAFISQSFNPLSNDPPEPEEAAVSIAMLKALIAAGADPRSLDNAGLTARERALMMGQSHFALVIERAEIALDTPCRRPPSFRKPGR